MIPLGETALSLRLVPNLPVLPTSINDNGCNWSKELIRLGDALAGIIDELVRWDKETAIWWAGACEVMISRRNTLNWLRLPFPQAHH
jgi:hypothetical protein